MKSLILSILIIAAIITFTVTGTVLTDRSLEEISAYTEKIDSTSADFDVINEQLSSAEKSFSKSEKFLSLTLCDEHLEEIKRGLTDIKSSASAESREGVITAKSRLISYIEELRRLSSFSIETIF